MRRTFLVIAASIALAAGCDAIGTERPPLVVDKGPHETPSGPTPGGGTTNGVQPQNPATPVCWSHLLPPEVQPIQPKLTVAEACGLGASTTEWSYPSAWTGTNSVRNVDHRNKIVGRWATCGSAGVSEVRHAGIEFGHNGRWQLLENDAAGALVPLNPPVRGYYYALGNGQLNLSAESPGERGNGGFMKFAAGMDAIRFEFGITMAPPAIYARATPSPSNGRDNTPSITDGRCDMVGTWDVPPNNVQPIAPAISISFDADGNFVAGPVGSNLCQVAPMYGTYRLSPGMFQLTTNVNMGLCDWWFSAGYPAKFAPTCDSVTLTQHWDNCTGGRGHLNGVTTLNRRK